MTALSQTVTRSIVTSVAAAVVLYYAAAAYLLRFRLDSLLFPSVADVASVHDPAPIRLGTSADNELPVRRYGEVRTGCAVFFPGRHGELDDYRETLFRRLAASGVAVFAVEYPGQDGVRGSTTLREIPESSRRTVRAVMQVCGRHRTVVLGRSLGGVVAAYAAAGASPAGLVLDSTAPSLSAAITAHLQAHWYLRPLTLLPIEALIAHDYSLSDALSGSPGVRVVLFQGTADLQTPISSFRRSGALPPNVHLVMIEGGTHSNTYRLALADYIEAVVGLISQ